MVGVSFDTPAENAAFRDKESFGYPLWSDGAKALAKRYGVIRAGLQPYASRVTVVLDPQGRVVHRIPNDAETPDAAGHAEAAIAALERLTRPQ